MSQELRARLASLPKRPWRIDEVSREDVLPGIQVVVGALRAADNRNVVEPSPESASMIVGLTEVLEFLRDAPEIIEGLLDLVGAETPVNPAVTE